MFDSHLEQFFARGHERTAHLALQPRRVVGLVVPVGEELDHLHEDALGPQELHSEVEAVGEEDLGVEGLDYGQGLGHGVDEQVDRQLGEDGLERAVVEAGDEAGRLAELLVLVQGDDPRQGELGADV